jgi:hypothetical protein
MFLTDRTDEKEKRGKRDLLATYIVASFLLSLLRMW